MHKIQGARGKKHLGETDSLVSLSKLREVSAGSIQSFLLESIDGHERHPCNYITGCLSSWVTEP